MQNITNTELFNLAGFEHAAIFENTTYPWEVLPNIESYIRGIAQDAAHATSADFPGVHIGENIVIGEGTVIEPGATIKSNVLIGKNCEIRTGAYIRENVIIGDGCVVGNSTELKNAVLMNGVQVPHYNYVGDSVLGNNTHFGGGAGASNTKTPPSKIVIKGENGVEYPTGLLKAGAFVGDDAEIGVHAVLSPGTVIGKRSIVYPLALIRGIISADSIVKVKQQQEVVERKK